MVLINYLVFFSGQLSRKITEGCNICFRLQRLNQFQLVGQLPRARVNQAIRTFIETRVDYTAPIWLHVNIGRNTRQYEGCISIFVWVTTKTIHIELRSYIIAEPRQFTSRRGRLVNM